MTDNQTDTFTQLAGHSPSFWEKYVRGRGSIAKDSFWKRLADYHKSLGNGQFSYVHDLGAGPGVHSVSLAEYFSHVTVTDPNPKFIEVATARLSERPDAKKFTCRVGRGEDPVTAEEKEKYDMVFLGCSVHWMEKTALDNIATSLKPGGTFVATLFGLPDVTDEIAHQAIIKWIHDGLERIIEQGPSPLFGYSCIIQDDHYDSLKLDPERWGNITRIKLNKHAQRKRGLLSPKFYKTYPDRSSNTIEGRIVTEEDRDFYVTTDVNGLRDVIGSLPFPESPEADKKLWDTIGKIYESKPVDIEYGVCIVLATKK